MEIQRLDQEVKNLFVDTKQREERKDRLIEQLKDTIEQLKSDQLKRQENHGLGITLTQISQNLRAQQVAPNQPYQSSYHNLINQATYFKPDKQRVPTT